MQRQPGRYQPRILGMGGSFEAELFRQTGHGGVVGEDFGADGTVALPPGLTHQQAQQMGGQPLPFHVGGDGYAELAGFGVAQAGILRPACHLAVAPPCTEGGFARVVGAAVLDELGGGKFFYRTHETGLPVSLVHIADEVLQGFGVFGLYRADVEYAAVGSGEEMAV